MGDHFTKYLPSACVDMPTPRGGMFLWLRIKVEDHPDFPDKSPQEITHQVFMALIEEKVLVAQSKYFKSPSLKEWTREEEAKRQFLRVSFSFATAEEMEEGVKRMGRAFRKEWGISE